MNALGVNGFVPEKNINNSPRVENQLKKAYRES